MQLASAAPPLEWGFFLSHKQSNAQDAVMTLRTLLEENLPFTD